MKLLLYGSIFRELLHLRLITDLSHGAIRSLDLLWLLCTIHFNLLSLPYCQQSSLEAPYIWEGLLLSLNPNYPCSRFFYLLTMCIMY